MLFHRTGCQGEILLEDMNDYLVMTPRQLASPWQWVDELIEEVEAANHLRAAGF